MSLLWKVYDFRSLVTWPSEQVADFVDKWIMCWNYTVTMLFENVPEKCHHLIKCGLFLFNTVLKSQFCQTFVIQGGVWLGIFLVQLPFVYHPAVCQLSCISLNDFGVLVPCLKFPKHLEVDFPCAVFHWFFLVCCWFCFLNNGDYFKGLAKDRVYFWDFLILWQITQGWK
jgi:hypothetical protein